MRCQPLGLGHECVNGSGDARFLFFFEKSTKVRKKFRNGKLTLWKFTSSLLKDDGKVRGESPSSKGARFFVYLFRGEFLSKTWIWGVFQILPKTSVKLRRIEKSEPFLMANHPPSPQKLLAL